MSLQSKIEDALEKSKLKLTVLNPHHKDLTISYDGASYLIKAGEQIAVDYFKAKHFAKHIANAILESRNKPMTEENRQEIIGSILI